MLALDVDRLITPRHAGSLCLTISQKSSDQQGKNDLSYLIETDCRQLETADSTLHQFLLEELLTYRVEKKDTETQSAIICFSILFQDDFFGPSNIISFLLFLRRLSSLHDEKHFDFKDHHT